MMNRLGWSKVRLRPAALAGFAAALLSLLVVFSLRSPDSAASLMQEGEAASGSSITEGRFAGLTEDGTTIVVDTTTINASSSNSTRSDATGVQVSLTAKDGTAFRAEAREGSINPLAKSAEISGSAVLSANGEFVVQSDGFRFSLDRTWFRSLGRVDFRFPGGTGSAGSMRLLASDSGGGAEAQSRLEFSRNVIVVYNLHGQ